MKEYKVGDRLLFRKSDEERAWAEVTHVGTGDPLVPVYYMVRVEGEVGGFLIRPSAIVDLEQVSADASAALDRMRERDLKRSDMLMELLGRLGYWASVGGYVRYSESGRAHHADLQGLVDEFLGRIRDL
jgi:hypothetical protein